jgi:hypothetical protein
MPNSEEIQNMAAEQALSEQNQLLRKQLGDMNAQMQAIMAQLQGNKIPQSSQASQEQLINSEIANAEAVILVETAQQNNKRVIDYEAPQNYQSVYYPQPSPTPEVLIQAPQQRQAKVQRRNNPPVLRYPPSPVSQEDIYKQLVVEGLLSPIPTRPWKPPYPAWYDPNVNCVYHSDMAGHSTENCIKLRQRINELVNTGSIKIIPVERELLKTNDQRRTNNEAFKESISIIREGKDDQGIEEICWQGKHREDTPVAVIGDGPASSNIWKIPQGEEGPRSYTVTPMTFPEI